MDPRRRGARGVAVAGPLLLAAALVLGGWAAVRWAGVVRYALAPACAGGDRGGCVREVPATVLLRAETGWPRTEHVLTYRTGDDSPGPGRVTLVEPGRLFPLLAENTAIVLHVWDGHVVRVTVPGAGTVGTTDTPLTGAVVLSAFALLPAASGAALVAWSRRRTTHGAVAVLIGAYVLVQGRIVTSYPEEMLATFAVATVAAGVGLVRFSRTAGAASPPRRRAARQAAR